MRRGSHHLIVSAGGTGSILGAGRRLGGSQNVVKDNPTGELPPENVGIGMPLAARSPITMNLHHFNSTQDPLLKEAWVNFWYVDAEQVTQEAREIFLWAQGTTSRPARGPRSRAQSHRPGRARAHDVRAPALEQRALQRLARPRREQGARVRRLQLGRAGGARVQQPDHEPRCRPRRQKRGRLQRHARLEGGRRARVGVRNRQQPRGAQSLSAKTRGRPARCASWSATRSDRRSPVSRCRSRRAFSAASRPRLARVSDSART